MISSVADAILSMPAWLVLLMACSMPALESSICFGFVFPGEVALVVAGGVAGAGPAHRDEPSTRQMTYEPSWATGWYAASSTRSPSVASIPQL